MTKNFLFSIVALLLGNITALEAKINYVPLYFVDTTQADVNVPEHAASMPLFITQDGYRLTLPDIDDSMTLLVLRGSDCVFREDCQRRQSTSVLPTALAGDYEVRLSAGTYYYYGYLTLGSQDGQGIPGENANWENITLLGSNTSQEAILDDIMGLHVVEYNMKMPTEDVYFLNEEQKEAYIKHWEEIRANRRIGLLPEELDEIFPQLVKHYDNGEFAINYVDLIPVLISCVQELKCQLDSRTEAIVDAMSRKATTSDISAVRATIGNTLLSAATTAVSEPARVRYILTDDVSNASIAITDMGGRVVARVPVTPSETSASIGSGVLGEGIFLCTLYADGKIIGTKRLVKTK